MKEKDEAHQTHLTERIKESDFAINYDRICLQQDKEERINKEKYLQQFRNENKRVSIFNFPLDSFFFLLANLHNCLNFIPRSEQKPGV